MSQQPPMTLAYAKARLQDWLDALERCSTGETYSIGNRTLTRQDVEGVIQPQITRWHRSCAALEQAAAGRVRPLGAQAAFPAPGAGSGGLISQDLWESGRT